MKFSDFRAGFFKTFAVICVSAVLAVSGLAQSGTSGVSGTVRDGNGAVVPGATVKISNVGTGFERSVTTNDDGSYSFPGLQPSVYKLEITANGFKRLSNAELRLAVDSPIRYDPVLEAGDVSATVDVTTSSIESIVNTQDATLGNNILPQQITQLPTDLRRINNLLALQPGVTRDGYVAGGR
ncbi:MAG TPA: carboxypeptidase-like regulatory domain-containing protein, partial [Pyrinomonadaceae bacterium]|nr:carboxypeptidase-like regulatory domain-containing protein [Pyrinomonadaceae bacterium]